MALSTFLANHGITHDSALWAWGKVLSVAALVASGALDLTYWSQYLGIHLNTTEIHWGQVLAIVALYLSGQYSGSPLVNKQN